MSAGKRNLQPVLGATPSDLVRENHPYRRLLEMVPFDDLCAPLSAKYSPYGRRGYPVSTMFKAIVLQWMEELSDRECERYLQENVAAKFFCGFGLSDPTPDHSTLQDFRDRVGTESLGQIFEQIRLALKDMGLVREVFTFVDATHLISKLNLWNERDKVIEAGEKKLSNHNISKVAADKEARLGKKGAFKWFGFKTLASVDMSNGLICRVAVVPANVDDTKGARHVLPRQGMVFADKAFGVGQSALEMDRRGLHSGAILKKGMKKKNHDKDRWLSSVRMPYEGTFSQFEKRARYRARVKCQFQAFMQAISHNLKRLVKIEAPPLALRPYYA